MIFSTAANEYMDDKRKRLRATTLEGYESAIRCHLLPRWGEREIETITFEQVQEWVDSFELAGAAEKAYVGLQVAATTNRNVWNHGETSWFI